MTIFHDETVEGGCELRTKPYWETRQKIVRAMTLRTRLHNQGHIPVAPALRLARSAFLNLNLIRREPSWGLRQS